LWPRKIHQGVHADVGFGQFGGEGVAQRVRQCAGFAAAGLTGEPEMPPQPGLRATTATRSQLMPDEITSWSRWPSKPCRCYWRHVPPRCGCRPRHCRRRPGHRDSDNRLPPKFIALGALSPLARASLPALGGFGGHLRKHGVVEMSMRDLASAHTSGSRMRVSWLSCLDSQPAEQLVEPVATSTPSMITIFQMHDRGFLAVADRDAVTGVLVQPGSQQRTLGLSPASAESKLSCT
jgi:hypothetical protein